MNVIVICELFAAMRVKETLLRNDYALLIMCPAHTHLTLQSVPLPVSEQVVSGRTEQDAP